MSLESTLLLRRKINSIATRYATLMSHDAQRRAEGILASRTGKTFRSFKAAIRTDRNSGFIYGFGVTARYTAFIQNYGQGAGTKSGGNVRAHSRRNMAVRSYRRTFAGGKFLTDSLNTFAPRIAQRMAKTGAESIAKIMKNSIQNG